jgi:hypothetical protein
MERVERRPARPAARETREGLAPRRHRATFTAMTTNTCPAFLLRYQEPVAPRAETEMSLGTMTKTSARESADQDASSDWMRIGTSTFTEAREQADQDPSHHVALGTQTRTDSRESSDSDPSRGGWAVIPRS